MTMLLSEAPAVSSPAVSPVLVAEDFAHGSRSRRGERLDHVFEQRCDWPRRMAAPRRLPSTQVMSP